MMIPLVALTRKVCKWKQYSQERVLVNSLVNNFPEFDISNAKLDEFNKWKTHNLLLYLSRLKSCL